MRQPGVLVIHNRYQQAGGEDAVVSAEMAVLRQHGHLVTEYGRDNREIAAYSAMRKAALLVTNTWKAEAYRAVRSMIRETRPAVAHCHNLMPLASPAVYYACRAEGVPVVQTLHNFRLRCPAGTMFHAGRACEGCNHPLVAGCRQGCYRGSRWQTAAAALSVAVHRRMRTYDAMVDAYSAPSAFCAAQLAGTAVPREKVRVRPHFLTEDPGTRKGAGDYALYVGRLCEEKGVRLLLEAWKQMPHVPLLVVGDGPLAEEVRNAAGGAVRYAGALSRPETLARMQGARFVVFPSIGYETFGMTVVEAAACGAATIGTRLGAIPELVREGETGLLFEARNSSDLIAKAAWAWEHPEAMSAMGAAARRQYLQRFTAERGYAELCALYGAVSPAWAAASRAAA